MKQKPSPKNLEVLVSLRARLPRELSAAEIRRKGTQMLRALGWDAASVSVSVVSDREISRLHQEYLQDPSPTDVITFGAMEGRGPEPRTAEGLPFLGDVVISWDTARRQAAFYRTSPVYEFYFYLCHGFLHLAGFEDRTKALRNRMHRIQRAILADAGLPAPASEKRD